MFLIQLLRDARGVWKVSGGHVRADEGTEKTKRRGWRITGWVVLVIAVYILLDSGLIPWGYVRSAPISGTIIDKETGQPIPHAVIVVEWPQMRGTPGGTIYVGSGTIKLIYVFSDEQGNYLVPGWKRSKWEIGEGGFTKDRVEMYIRASGYWPRTLHNREEGGLGWGEAWKAEWDGEDIELEPMHWREWMKEEWERQHQRKVYGYKFSILRLNNNDHDWPPNNCDWKRRPKDFLEGMRYQLRMMEMLPGHYKVVKRTPDELKKIEKDCGANPYQYLKRYGITDEEWKACCVETQGENAGKKVPQSVPVAPSVPVNEWKACCEHKVEKRASPHTTVIMLESFKVMPDGRLIPLETEKAGIKRTTPGESVQKHGKRMAGK